MLNEKFTLCFKVTITWNPTKSHATRLKYTKYKTRDKTMCLNMNELWPDQFHDLSYAATQFLSYQKFPEVKIVCSYSKESDLY